MTTLNPGPQAAIAVPWHGLDGNRLVGGSGPVVFDSPVDVEVGGDAVSWLVGAVVAGEPTWVAVDTQGLASVIRTVAGGGFEVERVEVVGAPAPPVVAFSLRSLGLVRHETANASPPAPALVAGPGAITIEMGGAVRIGDGAPLQVDALPDARPVLDGKGRMLVLSGATSRYRHGVLGDEIEASSVTLIELDSGTVTEVVRVGPDEVIEGTAPIWADVDGDGRRDIVVTISTPGNGARIAVYAESGELIAESDPIGLGGRWRHQVAVAPIGPGGELEIVDVLTPHIGGVVEFFRLADGRLDIVAARGGFTSHFIGSRNLSVPVVADVDGDGSLEVVVPTQERERIAGVARTVEGTVEAWIVPLGGRLSSNLSAVELPGGGLALAAGRSDGTVRIWPPAD